MFISNNESGFGSNDLQRGYEYGPRYIEGRSWERHVNNYGI